MHCAIVLEDNVEFRPASIQTVRDLVPKAKPASAGKETFKAPSHLHLARYPNPLGVGSREPDQSATGAANIRTSLKTLLFRFYLQNCPLLGIHLLKSSFAFLILIEMPFHI